MGPGPTRDLVMKLRAKREELGLSIKEVMELLKENSEATGAALPAESSVRSVLKGDLERISGFSHDATLFPLENVLLKEEAKDGIITQAQIDGLLDIIKIQEETIKSLAEQLKVAEEIQKTRCRKCEQDMEIYKSQIKIKDKRMERKDKWIAELLKLPNADEEDA